MKRIEKCGLSVTVVLLLFLISCVSTQDKVMTLDERQGMENLGQVSVSFTSFQLFHTKLLENSMKEKAYTKLLNEAKAQYKGEVDASQIDIRNIKLNGNFSGWELLMSVWPAIVVMSPSYGNDDPLLPLRIAVGMLPLAGNFQKITATADVVTSK